MYDVPIITSAIWAVPSGSSNAWALPRYGIPRSVPSSGPAALIAWTKGRAPGSTCSDKTRLWRSSVLSPNTLTSKGKGSPILKQLWTSTSCSAPFPAGGIGVKDDNLRGRQFRLRYFRQWTSPQRKLTNRYGSCESICRAIRAILWSIHPARNVAITT